MTATAVCSLSSEPPLLVTYINRSSTLARTLTQTGWFSVNLLTGDQEDVAASFVGRGGWSGDRCGALRDPGDHRSTVTLDAPPSMIHHGKNE